MGLDISPGNFHMAYGSFNQFRRLLARTVDMELNAMEGFGGMTSWPESEVEPLVHFLNHSDCDGEISWQFCADIANRLKVLKPAFDEVASGFNGYFATRYEALVEAFEIASEEHTDMEFM